MRWIIPRNVSRAAVLALALIAISALSACGPKVHVRTDVAPGIDLERYGTYAFLDATDGRSSLDTRVEDAVSRRLDALGLSRVPLDGANLAVSYDRLIEIETRYLDAFARTFYSHERFENGTLLIELVDRATAEVVWSASAQSELRVVARGYGVSAIRFEPTEELPEWKIEDKVNRMMKPFGGTR